MSDRVIDNPIINSPYEAPTRYFDFDREGITDRVLEGRRPSSFFIPVPRPRKRGNAAPPSPQGPSVEMDEGAWSSLYSTTSRPFPRPDSGKIAVKVINHYGDGVLKVYDV